MADFCRNLLNACSAVGADLDEGASSSNLDMAFQIDLNE